MVCVPDSETPAAVYEVLPNERAGDGNPEEWMYELRGIDAWDGYNDAVESSLKGDRSAAERWAASEKTTHGGESEEKRSTVGTIPSDWSSMGGFERLTTATRRRVCTNCRDVISASL
ncbi:hypothetical protein DIPPA_00508 [Diplonema papillatum]|nr:hypothetical protein DIPPA_00508 [Diplonema papillatum]